MGPDDLYEMEENGNLVRFIFNQEREAVTEEDSTGIIRLIRGSALIARNTDAARTYYHYASDEMGSTTHIVDENGNVQNRYEYDAWGNLTSQEEAIPNRFKYTGQQLDPVTQQYYLRARFYNPVIARFTQEDTYRGDGLNLYAYCANNPVYYVDPSGFEKDVLGKTKTDVDALSDLIDELNLHDGAHTKGEIDILQEWANEYGVDELFGYVKTNYGYALQSFDESALLMRDYVVNGGHLYRGGTLGRSAAAEGQFWAAEHPSTPGYPDRYGVDFSKMEFIERGSVIPGTEFITRPAPGLNGNRGGGIEVVTPAFGVKLDAFSVIR